MTIDTLPTRARLAARMRQLLVLAAVALVTLVSQSTSLAATRARTPAETVLNDSSVRLSAGGAHTCQVKEDGTVRCWGANNVGQLGNGSKTTEPTRVPVLVDSLTSAVAVSAGGSHTCALLAGGTVRCWGEGGRGQLGNGATSSFLVPVAVSGLTTAVAVSAGSNYNCALLAGGTVRCWGAGGSQLGIGTNLADQLTPVAVSGLSNAVAITAAGGHTCALLANGTVRCWGQNFFGELGIGTFGGNQFTPVAVSGLSTAVAIAAGSAYTCALLANGTARCWGRNVSGRLGDGTTVDRSTPVVVSGLTDAVAITTGGSHTCALLAFGTAQCWGSNGNGQIGDGTTVARLTPVQVAGSLGFLEKAVSVTAGSAHTCGLLADGSAKCWGSNSSGQLGISNTAPNNTAPTPVLGGGGSVTARDIAAGRNHTCAVRANGTVACWGSNDSGQIGDGTIGGTRLSPVTVPGLTNVVALAAGEAHTCALLAVGVPVCWGLNSSGQLGNGTLSSSPTPVGILGLNSVVAIAAGGALGSSHTCALRSDGTVRCWGANGSGQLGTGNTSPSSVPVIVAGLTNAVSIAVGEFHTCARVAVGVPFCWGFNGNGRLGTSPGTNPLLPALVSLDNTVTTAVGNAHTCALRADATAWCWGANLLGQLGINSTVSQSAPTLVVNLNLPNAVAIAGGTGHTCALVAGGTIVTGDARCWGDNSLGQLGFGSTIGSSTTPVVVRTLKTVSVCSFGGGCTTTTIANPIWSVVGITTGGRHSCALYSSGGLVCWGDNSSGQLGNNSTTTRFNPVTVLSFTLNIDPSVVLKHNERVSTVTILANCEAGQQLHVEVALTQGLVRGAGIGSGQCTGGLERYAVTVPGYGGPNAFHTGPAVVTAQALIRQHGEVVDTQEWTRAVAIGSAP